MARDERYQARKAYIKKWARERYKRERENGICVFCHKPWKGIRSYCDECATRTLERRKTKHKTDRQQRKEDGLCQRCGYPRNEDADKEKLTCFACRASAALQKGYSI